MNSNTSIPKDFESHLSSLFDDKQKIIVFNKIASLYFNKNFGTTSKADFELLMFSFFIRNSKDSKNAGELFGNMWIFIHGAACMSLTGDYDLSDAETKALMERSYHAFLSL